MLTLAKNTAIQSFFEVPCTKGKRTVYAMFRSDAPEQGVVPHNQCTITTYAVLYFFRVHCQSAELETLRVSAVTAKRTGVGLGQIFLASFCFEFRQS